MHSRYGVYVMLLVLVLLAIPAQALRLSATQSLMLEYDGDGPGVMGTVVVDLALAPAWHLTYIHDRSWVPTGRSQVHDVSVTRYMAHDRSATLGYRVKVPEPGRNETAGYLLVAWRWGE